MAGAGVGLFTYLADDATLRTLTFWNLGSLNGASYARLWPLLLATLAVALWLPRRARALNALLLGEQTLQQVGFSAERAQRAAGMPQRELEQKAQGDAFRAEEATRAAEREKKLADKEPLQESTPHFIALATRLSKCKETNLTSVCSSTT